MSASTWLGGSGFAPRPFRGWLQRAPRVRAVGAWLAPTGPDPRADALESLADKCGVAQQQAFQVLRQRGQAVLEVGLRCVSVRAGREMLLDEAVPVSQRKKFPQTLDTSNVVV